MKVILQQDVKGSGVQGDIINVSDGYARNYLFPRKLAVPADAAHVNSSSATKRPRPTG
jgi:large subunit ribosomal protein L9